PWPIRIGDPGTVHRCRVRLGGPSTREMSFATRVDSDGRGQPQRAEQAATENVANPVLASVDPGEAHECQKHYNQSDWYPACGRGTQTTIAEVGEEAEYRRERRQMAAWKA